MILLKFPAGIFAGAHLAASLGYSEEKFISEVLHAETEMVRPNGMILSYPVISSGKFAHTGLLRHCLELTAAILKKEKKQSLEFQVTTDTPPTFLWHTVTDDCVPVENSLLFFEALHKYKVPVELHLYPTGGHGLSLANEETSHEDGGCIQPECKSWMELACTWIRKFIKK